MNFIDIVNQLKRARDSCFTDNNVQLIHPEIGRPLVARHLIYPGLSETLLEQLKKAYWYDIPKEIIDILEVANGM